MRTGRDGCGKQIDEVREEAEQRMMRFTVTLVGRIRAERLTRLLVTESVKAIDAVVQQLVHDAVSRLRYGFERAFSTVCVPFPVASTRVSGVAVTSNCWRGERSGDHGESEPAEGCPPETRQCSTKVSRPRGIGKGSASRC